MNKIVGSVTFLERNGDPSTEGENTYTPVSVLSISEDVYESIINGDNYPSKITLREANIRTGKKAYVNDRRNVWHKLGTMAKLMLFYYDIAVDNKCHTCRIELFKF